MKKFSDFNIKIESEQLLGEKININKVFNKEIQIENYKIVDSKFNKGNGKCLHIQFTMDNQQKILFTGSGILMKLLEQVNKKDFPFITTIIKENQSFLFQ